MWTFWLHVYEWESDAAFLLTCLYVRGNYGIIIPNEANLYAKVKQSIWSDRVEVSNVQYFMYFETLVFMIDKYCTAWLSKESLVT